MKVHLDGIELHVEQSGAGQDLLFIPGLGACTHAWYAQVRTFSTHRRVTAYDPRGHGQSDRPPGPYAVAELAADAAGVIERLGLQSPVVVASSMSCMVAIELAATRPEQVGALVLVGGFARLPPAGREKMKERIALVRAGGMPALVDLVAAGALGPTTHQTQPGLLGLFRHMLLQNDPEAYAASVEAILGGDVTDRLCAVTCPVLLLWGAEEAVAPLPLARELRRGIPGSRSQVLTGCGHPPFLESPAAFNAALWEFLSEIEA